MTALLVVLGVLAYLAGTVPATAIIMRAIADSEQLGGCHNRNGLVRHEHCRATHGVGCWRNDGLRDPDVLRYSATWGLAWPLLVAPYLALRVAARKPSRASMERRIRQLEQENDL